MVARQSGYSQAMRDVVLGCVSQGGGDEILGTSDDTIPAAYPECMSVSAMADTDNRTAPAWVSSCTT
jgi:hypothetical protein